MALVSSHYPFAEKKISEECSDHKILPEKLFEQCPRQSIPRNGVSYCGEYPVEFTKRTSPILQTSGHPKFIDRYIRLQGIL
jgi:hypothetical protein